MSPRSSRAGLKRAHRRQAHHDSRSRSTPALVTPHAEPRAARPTRGRRLLDSPVVQTPTDSDSDTRPVWWFTDGKPGHVSQVHGLLNALRVRQDVELTTVDCAPSARPLKLPPTPKQTPLLLGAGRATHRPLLTAKRVTGGLAVVLMNPVGPTGRHKRGFDLKVIPEHDGVAPHDGVILTVGALNPLTAEGPHAPDHGVMLIGGPSRRFGWDAQGTLENLRDVIKRSPGVHQWAATSSRRTPAAFLDAMAQLKPAVSFTPAADTPAGWVGQQLARSQTAWVTEDSVSMVFEALTAGCRVGLLPVPRRRGLAQRLLGRGPGRVVAGAQRLISDGRVTRYQDWRGGQALPPPRPLAEAQRVARLVLEQWNAHALA